VCKYADAKNSCFPIQNSPKLENERLHTPIPTTHCFDAVGHGSFRPPPPLRACLCLVAAHCNVAVVAARQRDIGGSLAAAWGRRWKREARWQQCRGCGGGGSATARRWRQLGGGAAAAVASAAVAATRSKAAVHSATTAARLQQRRCCGGGGSVIGQCRRQLGCSSTDASAVAAARQRDVTIYIVVNK
jgi:hypothetical protein